MQLASHEGGTKVDMLEYLKLAQDLEMYGLAFYPVNEKGSDILIGIDCLGINFYRPEDKDNPEYSIPFSEVRKVKASDKELAIKFVADKGIKPTKVRGKLPNSTKKIKACIDGNMELCMQRHPSFRVLYGQSCVIGPWAIGQAGAGCYFWAALS